MKSYLIAGMISGAAGLLVFLAIHHVWIRPIWGILPIGSLLAGLGGLAVGWAYAEIQIGLPPRPWTAAAVFALIAVTLIPGALLAQLRPPPLDITTGTLISGTPAGIALRFFLELLLTAALVGGLAGRRERPASMPAWMSPQRRRKSQWSVSLTVTVVLGKRLSSSRASSRPSKSTAITRPDSAPRSTASTVCDPMISPFVQEPACR